MPTNRKRVAKGRVGAGGITEIDYLFYTFGAFFDAVDYEDGKSEAELKAFWNKHRGIIIQRNLEENRLRGWAGCRPWSFWKYDMPEPQRKTPPGEFDSLKVWDHQRKKYAYVETEYAFLKRLNLLEKWEIECYQK